MARSRFEVAHHGGDERFFAKRPARVCACAQRHEHIAVDDGALLIDDDHAIGVAVEGHADRGAARFHLGHDMLGVQGAGVAVDVAAVGPTSDGVHVRTELGKHRGRHSVRRAVGGIDHDPHAVERAAGGEGALAIDDIATRSVVDALCFADAVAGGVLVVEPVVLQ